MKPTHCSDTTASNFGISCNTSHRHRLLCVCARAASAWCGNDELIFISYCYDRQPSRIQYMCTPESAIKECESLRCDEYKSQKILLFIHNNVVECRSIRVRDDEHECFRRFVEVSRNESNCTKAIAQ